MLIKPTGTWFDRAYVDLLDGDVQAALLLSQIAFWCRSAKDGSTKLRVKKDGLLCLAKSALDWHAELGLTAKQSRRCIEVLRSHGIIETTVRRFNGSPTTHIRLTTKGTEIVNGVCGHVHLPSGANPTYQQVNSITEDTAEKTTDMKPAGKPAKHSGEGEEKQGTEDTKEVQKPSQPMKLALGNFWNELLEKKFNATTKPLTKKELGQLSQFQSKLGELAKPLLEFVFSDWYKFTYRVKWNRGLSSTPVRPVVGFMLANFDVALELMKEKEASIAAAKAMAKQNEVATKCDVPSIKHAIPAEPEYKLTPEEIAADLALFAPKQY